MHGDATGLAEGGAPPAYVSGAIIGGLAIGVPTAFLNCCCFIFGPIGGVVAAWSAGRRATWFGAQEGAMAAACAGAVGWLVQAGISVPLTLGMYHLVRGNPRLLDGLPPLLQQAYQQEPSLGAMAFGQVLTLGVLVVTSVIGGALAGQTFLRREPRSGGFPYDAYGPGSADDSRPCPVCGERIKTVAIKCRFCGTSFGPPPAAPSSAPGPTALPPPPA